jgi:DNA-binding transcriptional regulator YiaG
MPSASPKTPETALADAIKALRKRMGLNVEQFGALFLVSPRTVENWEQGLRKPKGLTLRAIEKVIAKQNRKRPLT